MATKDDKENTKLDEVDETESSDSPAPATKRVKKAKKKVARKKKVAKRKTGKKQTKVDDGDSAEKGAVRQQDTDAPKADELDKKPEDEARERAGVLGTRLGHRHPASIYGIRRSLARKEAESWSPSMSF